MSKTKKETKPTTMDDMISGDAPVDDVEDEAVEAAEEDAPEAEETPEPEAKEDKTVPLSVLIEERKKLQEDRDYWERVAKESRTPNAPPPEAPDFLAEPEKIGGYIDQKVTAATQALSKRYAVRTHGQPAVDAAYAALRDHGTEAEKAALIASEDPWGDVVEWNKKRELVSEIGTDPDAWRARERERLRKELLAEAAVAQAKGKTPGAPSMAAEPNTGTRGGDEWTGPTRLSDLLDR